MEQRWKWEASFICGEKASFVQYLLDNYTERDLVDMVTDIEDTKKAIDCQEKEMETGILYSDLEDKPYSWQSIKIEMEYQSIKPRKNLNTIIAK